MEEGKIFSERKIEIFLLVLVVLLLAVQFAFIFRQNIHFDERVHLHSAYLISEGKAPFVDFVAHHMPLFWYALSALMSLPPIASIFAGRIIEFIFSLCILLLVYKISMKFGGRKAVALLAVFLTLSFRQFFISSFSVRPDTLATLLVLFSFWLVLDAKDSRWGGFLTGLALSLSVFVHLKAVFIAVPLGFIYIFTRKVRWGSFIIGGVIPPAILAVIFSPYTAEFKNIFFLLFMFSNLLRGGNPILYNIATYIAVNSFLIFSLFFALADFKYARRNLILLVPAAASLVFVAYAAFKGLMGPQYLLFAVPFAALFSAEKAAGIFSARYAKIGFLLFAGIGVLIPCAAIGYEFYRADIGSDIRELNYFISEGGAGSASLDAGWLIFHKDVSYLWFSDTEDFDRILIGKGIIKDFNLTRLIDKSPMFIKSNYFRFDDDEMALIDAGYSRTEFANLYERN